MKRFLSVILVFVAIFSFSMSPDTVPPESDDVEIPSSGTETPIIDF